jgi:hypothetical protein
MKRILRAGIFFPLYAILIVWGFLAGDNLPPIAVGILAALVLVNIVYAFWPSRRIM